MDKKQLLCPNARGYLRASHSVDPGSNLGVRTLYSPGHLRTKNCIGKLSGRAAALNINII